jgi:hypothetical protein
LIEVRTKLIELPSAVKVGDREYRELNLIPPKVGWRLRAERHLRGGQHPEALSRYHGELIGKCAGVDAAVIEELYEPDFVSALQFVVAFQNAPQQDADPEESTRMIEFPEIKVEDRSYSQLILTKTKLGWRRQAEGYLRNGQHPEALTNYSISLVARSANVDQRVITTLDDDIFFEAWAFVASFLPGGPAITTV